MKYALFEQGFVSKESCRDWKMVTFDSNSLLRSDKFTVHNTEIRDHMEYKNTYITGKKLWFSGILAGELKDSNKLEGV